MNELPTPPDLGSDPNAAEILRVWVIDQQLRCSLYTGAFEEPATWGVSLADVVRTVAGALGENEGQDSQKALREMVTAFHAELAEPQA